MKQNIKRLFIVIILYAVACGISQNFQELWLAENSLTTKSISNVFSLCALITVSIIFLCTNLIKKEHLKKFASILLLSRVFTVFLLYILNGTGLNFPIKFITIIDYAIDVEFFATLYPLIALSNKNNKYYAYKDIIYNGVFYLAVFGSTFLLGKSIAFINIDYNTYFLISSIIMLIAFIFLKNTDINIEKESNKENNINVFYELIQNIRYDRITNDYLIFLVTGQISNNIVLGLTMTILTTGLSLSSKIASYIVLISGVSSAVIGFILAKKKGNTKPEKALFVKYIIRFLLYILAIVFNEKYILILAIIYPKLVSVVYTHITDAPYVNRFSNDLQFAFCNLKEMLTYFSKAIGVFFCGFLLEFGIIYVFILAAIFSLLQVIYAYKALNERAKNDREQLG